MIERAGGVPPRRGFRYAGMDVRCRPCIGVTYYVRKQEILRQCDIETQRWVGVRSSPIMPASSSEQQSSSSAINHNIALDASTIALHPRLILLAVHFGALLLRRGLLSRTS
ncbi:hypothetical protein PMIN06_011238 [Paraphaeosphaeria minitans]